MTLICDSLIFYHFTNLKFISMIELLSMLLLDYFPQYLVLVIQGAQAGMNDWLIVLSLGEHCVKEPSWVSSKVTCLVNDLLNTSERLENWDLKTLLFTTAQII